MNTFAVLFFCVQACLVQNVFAQCLGRLAPTGCAPAAAVSTCGFTTPSNYAPGAIGSYGYPGIADYGFPGSLAGAYPGALGAYPGALAAPCGLETYGGAGEGNVAVAGELPVCGNTAVAGPVPILGAVRFGGDVCAGGAVSIAGNCACGCGCGGAPFPY